MAAHRRQSDHLAALGMLPFSPSFGLQLLEQVLADSDPQVAAMQADWPRLVQHFKLPLLAELAAELDGETGAAQTRSGLALQTQLRGLSASERRAAIMELLQKQLANVLRTPIHTIHPEQPLSELGIDSLMTVELVNRIEVELAVSVPIATLLQGPTLASLTEQLAPLVGEPTPPANQASARVMQRCADDLIACRVADLAGEAELDPPSK
ncbi:MAG: hypothetical protein IPK16_27825 [Anaerolineales bacterium]|nr:hypothetical protein [Anaerolineales bacterium]